jgi:ubiquinol-cytochrome c reductase cytochrome c subunit
VKSALALVALLPAAAAGAGPGPQSGIVTNPGSSSAGGVPPRLASGYSLYAANCSRCHGSRGEGITSAGPSRAAGGQSGAGPSLRGVGALAADFYLRTGYMPLSKPGKQPRRNRVFFTEAQIRALVGYVSSLGNGPRIPRPHPQTGSLSRGQTLFTEHCAGCHQIVAAGGYVTGAVVPPLTDATPTQIAEAIRIGPYLMPKFPKSQLSDADVDSIIRYVQYAKHPDDRGGWAIGHVGPIPEGIVTWLLAAVVLVGVCLLLGERLRPRT